MKKRPCSIYEVLTSLHDERAILQSGGDFGRLPNLEGLLSCLKAANPTANSIIFQGVEFPLLRALSLLIVLCPRTGGELIVQHDPAAKVKFVGPASSLDLVLAKWTRLSTFCTESQPQGNRNQRRRLWRKQSELARKGTWQGGKK